VSWFDWDAADASLTAYTRRVIAVRRAHPVLRRDRYLADPGYVVWYTPKGHPMTVSHWQSGRKSVAAYIDGTIAPDLDAHGQPMLDDDVLILVNGSPRPVTFTIPEAGKQCSWRTEVDSFDLGDDITKPDMAGATDTTGTDGTVRTGTSADPADRAQIGAGDHLTVRQRSLVLLLARNPALARPTKPGA